MGGICGEETMTKEELYSVRRLTAQISKQEEYIRGLRELIENTERLAGMSHGAISKKVEALTIKILAAEEKLSRLKTDLDTTREKLWAQILREYHEPKEIWLLINRYVECRTWTQTAAQMHYSRRSLYRLNKEIFSKLSP